MVQPATDSETVAVWFPPPGLAGLVICAIRRTTGEPGPSASHVHANPYACLNLVTHGSVAVPGWGELPSCFVTGPFTAPLATETRGPLNSISVVLQPWLLRELFALEVEACVDRVMPLEGDAAGLAPALADAAASYEAPRALWSRLQALIPDGSARIPARLALQTLQSRGSAAAAHALGVSARHYRRLFAGHMGLGPKAWLRTWRFEQALRRMAPRSPEPGATLAMLAGEVGYADQAHMSREFRSIALQPPARLQRGLQEGRPGSWSLRPAHVRFLQDE